MYQAISRSSVFVLDQDEAVDFYVNKLGLEVSTDQDLGFMRWLTVRVPGDPVREILLNDQDLRRWTTPPRRKRASS